MRANEIEIGKTYLVKVTGKVVPVKILCKVSPPHKGFTGKNLTTGKIIHLRSAGRCREPYHKEVSDG